MYFNGNRRLLRSVLLSLNLGSCCDSLFPSRCVTDLAYCPPSALYFRLLSVAGESVCFPMNAYLFEITFVRRALTMSWLGTSPSELWRVNSTGLIVPLSPET